MDIAALAQLKSRALDLAAAGRKYRELSRRETMRRDFYGALAATYERSAREMNIMLEKAQRATGSASIAA